MARSINRYICPYGHNSTYAPFGMKLEGQSTFVNKSEAPGSQAKPVPAENARLVDKNHVSSAPEKYCRHCGASLVAGAAYCQQCGKLLATSAAPGVASSPKQKQVPLVCPACGKQVLPGQKFCNKCGKSFAPVDKLRKAEIVDSKQVNDQSKASEGLTTLSFSELTPLLRRAFVFIEDEEWDRADEYLERVLDEELENAYAYLGKAMAAVKVRTPTLPTASEMKELVHRKEHARAKRFADTVLSSIIAGCEEQLEE